MKSKMVMSGVSEVDSDKIRETLRRVVEIANVAKRIPKSSEELAMRLFGSNRTFDVLTVEIGILKRCDALAREFKVVKRDDSLVRRKVFFGQDRRQEMLDVPLVWSATLPAPRTSKYRSQHGHDLSSRVPPPPPEAVEQLRLHRAKFERTEVWWVPRDIMVEKPPAPDPIVVGAVQTNTQGTFYFELHRWIDEDYEDSYWAKEGY